MNKNYFQKITEIVSRFKLKMSGELCLQLKLQMLWFLRLLQKTEENTKTTALSSTAFEPPIFIICINACTDNEYSFSSGTMNS